MKPTWSPGTASVKDSLFFSMDYTVGTAGGDVAPLDILDGDVLEVEANFFSRHSLG